jgi:hypothetical protein
MIGGIKEQKKCIIFLELCMYIFLANKNLLHAHFLTELEVKKTNLVLI